MTEKRDHDSSTRGRGPGGRRAGAALKKTKPTTARLFPELQEFVKRQAEQHPDGQSGVINDALDFYRRHIEKNGQHIYTSIVIGANGHGKAQDA